MPKLNLVPSRRRRRSSIKRLRVNQEISFSPLRVIGSNGEQLGELSREEALQKAQEEGLDLVEVSPNARPPVSKIMDFGKYKYEQTKALRKQKSKQKAGEIKEIRLGLKISEHDLCVKAKKAEGFLRDGNKVQIMLRFRGREITHKELGTKLLNNFIEKLQEVSSLEGGIKSQGMTMIVLLQPQK